MTLSTLYHVVTVDIWCKFCALWNGIFWLCFIQEEEVTKLFKSASVFSWLKIWNTGSGNLIIDKVDFLITGKKVRNKENMGGNDKRHFLGFVG